ncbi:MAG: stage III sporulation protein AD [Lachnospiraceae bacterium]|nr:stage III sporulation protein AD [Lachnospiraceae bacterium]
MSVFQISILGVAAVLLAVQLSGVRPEYGVYLSVACGVLIFAWSLDRVQAVIEMIGEFVSAAGMDSAYLTIILKITGIAYLTEFSAEICRDAGYGAIAGQIQIFAKLTILAVSTPILMALLELIQTFG